MRRLWFKKQMATELEEGRKTDTTRYNQLIVGEIYACVKGSRFKSKKFAEIKISSALKTTWRDVITHQYKEEGFSSPEMMEKFILKGKLVRNTLDDIVWNHSFKKVKLV